MTTAIVSLEDLKQQYLDLRSRMFKSNAEVYWEQGRLLIQIKDQLKHGQWLPWIKENLDLSADSAQHRMKIGTLTGLPKNRGNAVFVLENLAAIADVAQKNGLEPDAATEKWLADVKKRDAAERNKNKGKPDPKPKDKKPKPDPLPKGMSRQDAFLVFGIDVNNLTISQESLDILVRGLRQKRHPDKGGTNAEFTQLTKAMEILQS